METKTRNINFCFDFDALTVPQTACGGDRYGPRGIISSPLYPDNYRNNDRCEWNITVDEGHLVSFEFFNFSLEESASCKYDSVTVIIIIYLLS